MDQWYYHAPGRGRVGPLDAEAMRDAFKRREIEHDTLVWRAGLPEWQPLVRVLDELGLEGVRPESGLPPPLPPPSAARPVSPPPPAARATPSVRAPAPPSQGTDTLTINRRGCLIALAVAGVVAFIAFAILAAIALPAYQEYSKRARAAEAARNPLGTFDADRMERVDEDTRGLIAEAMQHLPPEDGCPDDYHFESVLVRRPEVAGDERGWSTLAPARAAEGVCAYDATFRGLGPELASGTIRYEARRDADGGIELRCMAPESLPRELVPESCAR